MPSNTFYKLSKDKKIRIIKAATKEFSNYTLMNASINRIIKEADISRGSFYIYFEDINDIYKYTISIFRKKIEEAFQKFLKKNKGDLFQSILDIYDYIIETGTKKANHDLCKKIFINLSLPCVHKEIEQKETPVFQNIIKLIDQTKLNIKNKEEMYLMIGMLFSLTMRFVVPILVMEENKKQAKQQFLLSLELLKNGFCKNERKDD